MVVGQYSSASAYYNEHSKSKNWNSSGDVGDPSNNTPGLQAPGSIHLRQASSNSGNTISRVIHGIEGGSMIHNRTSVGSSANPGSSSNPALGSGGFISKRLPAPGSPMRRAVLWCLGLAAAGAVLLLAIGGPSKPAAYSGSGSARQQPEPTVVSAADEALAAAGPATTLQVVQVLQRYASGKGVVGGSSSSSSGPDPHSHRLLARLRQQAYCEDAFSALSLPNVTQAKLQGLQPEVSMFLYQGQDAVSQTIIAGYAWESQDLNEILWAMAAPLPGQNVSAPGEGAAAPELFVDIGANVGAFTTNVAARGYEVAAFEGMKANRQLIRSTLCANPRLMSHATLYPFGLGAARDKCFLLSDTQNQGDGIAMCGEESEAAAAAKVPAGYSLRGAMELERLDSVLQRDVKCMKMDVEGYEPYVLRGAEGLLNNYTVWFLVIEFNPVLLRGALSATGEKPGVLLQLLARHGYSISETGFRGPWLDAAGVEAIADSQHNHNLYAVHPRFFAPAATAAPATAAKTAAAAPASGIAAAATAAAGAGAGDAAGGGAAGRRAGGHLLQRAKRQARQRQAGAARP